MENGSGTSLNKQYVFYTKDPITIQDDYGNTFTYPYWDNYSDDLYLFYFTVKPGKYTVLIEEDETLEISNVSYDSKKETLSIGSIKYRSSTGYVLGQKNTLVASILNSVKSVTETTV